MEKKNNIIFWIIGLVLAGLLLFGVIDLEEIFSVNKKFPTVSISPPLIDSKVKHFPSTSSLFTFGAVPSCGDMSDAGCGSGWEPQCFVNDCGNCGSHIVGGVTECSTCYFCVRIEPAPSTPTCPDHAPVWCEVLDGCVTTQPESIRACDCYKKFCVSSCSSKTLNYNGICVTGGDCSYETVGVECCADIDCGEGLVCKGYTCLKDELGKNLDFEFWVNDFSPTYWDTKSNYMFVEKANGISGSYSLGLTMPDTGASGGVDIFGCLYAEASQEVELTDIDEITYECETGTPFGWSCEDFDFSPSVKLKFRTYIDSDEFIMIKGLNTIDVKSYFGTHTLKFYKAICSESARMGTTEWQTRIDGVELVSSSLAQLEALLQEKIALIMELEGELIKQSQLISDLDVTLETKINLVQSLTGDIDEQLVLISQLELNLAEKIEVVQALELNIQEQAITILALTSQAEEQAVIIDSLELTISQQALLIGEMELTTYEQSIIIEDLDLEISQQAQIIDNLNLNLQQKIELISQLKLTTQEQADLIAEMELSFTEQQEIIDSLSRIIGEDVDYILELELSVSQSAEYINSLELTVAQQSDLISQLQLTTQEQADLISQLELNNEETAQLIANLNLQISQQAEIIDELDLTIQNDAEIIANLNLQLSEEADLIDSLHLTINEQIELISQLELSFAEEKELVSQLNLTIAEQQRILDELKTYRDLREYVKEFDLDRVLFKAGDVEVTVLYFVIGLGILLLLLIIGGGRRR